ncbi:SRPBCC family protein [Sphingobium agri]|uniref:SRPBCC family protein n=1 Tax=Sphingobium agri TaxID=2933566 RepID=A0ABT0DTZ0_9SPHN|nr:SRPBCC family protein [Sphingobium agri]MCK0530587.1 SRPBCC family protein [Sphingobium agri]
MADMTPGQQDDAPPLTAKHKEERAAATAGLPEATGSDVTGKTVTINRPRQEIYDFWRDFSNLPQVMDNVVSIEKLDDRRSRWTVKAPGGGTVGWTSLVTDDRPGELIAWTSEEDADVPNSGRIEFRDAPGNRGTWVTATILYDPPAGIIGKVIAKMFQRGPHIQARRDLRRLKQLMETGEIATAARTEAQYEEEQN